MIAGIVAVLLLLLALGSLPGLLQSGDPYYVTATPVNGSQEAVDASTLSERAYPYTTAALADASASRPGRSDPYWRGPVGFKEAFTHSPFDEVNALRQNYPHATIDEDVSVSRNGTLYRVEVTR